MGRNQTISMDATATSTMDWFTKGYVVCYDIRGVVMGGTVIIIIILFV